MLPNGPMLTVFLGFCVVILATVLVRHQILPTGNFSNPPCLAMSRGPSRMLLGLGSVIVSLLAFCVVMWELVG
jgi:hypothetical protein